MILHLTHSEQCRPWVPDLSQAWRLPVSIPLAMLGAWAEEGTGPGWIMHSLIPGWRIAKSEFYLSPEASPVTGPPGFRVCGGVPGQQLRELLLVPADAEHHDRH